MFTEWKEVWPPRWSLLGAPVLWGRAAQIAAEGKAIREHKWLKEASQHTGLIHRLKISAGEKQNKNKPKGKLKIPAYDPILFWGVVLGLGVKMTKVIQIICAPASILATRDNDPRRLEKLYVPVPYSIWV